MDRDIAMNRNITIDFNTERHTHGLIWTLPLAWTGTLPLTLTLKDTHIWTDIDIAVTGKLPLT